MSKSKSKSKSKQATFPNEYWRPDFEIYTYYPALFDHGRELVAADIQKPPPEGDVIANEIEDLIKKQNDFDERERRRHEIEWEIDHLSRSYQTTLLVGPNAYQKTWHLMNAMSELALVPVMHFKKKFARARPSQLELGIEPLIDVPQHPAYPSGHSTQNFLVAHVLSEVIGDDAELIARVFAIARRVAENREWAGVHYHSDTEAGEELAREIFPTMKRALADPIKEAIKEWQELELEERRTREEHPAPTHALQEAPKKWDDPFPSSHFAKHQWNLENTGQADGRRAVDINVRGAWKQLGIWQGGAAPERPVRVALIDLAVKFDHPALARRFDYDAARNLDYPNLPKRLGDGDAAKLREVGWTKEEDVKNNYVDAFGSLSSAHALACAGIIAADQPQVDRDVQTANGRTEKITEPGCLGIAPHCRIVPFRAMTLTEPVRQKRETLARAVLEAATGIGFDRLPKREPRPRRGPRWTVGSRGQRCHVLFLPLPLQPLPKGDDDPLALALAFAATKIPVIIPSGNRGTSSLSHPSEPGKHFQDPKSIDELSQLFGLDRDAVRAVFGEEKEEQGKQEGKSDEQILKELVFALRNETAVICVGSCNDQGRRARYSQYGDDLTLVAPSDDILPSPHEVENGARRPQSIATADLRGIGGYMQDRSHYTLSDNEFGFGGTSAAAAQVAGVVSLMLQANPRLRPTDVHQILCETARIKDAQEHDLLVADDGTTPSKPSAEFGHGLVDATRAVEEAQRRLS